METNDNNGIYGIEKINDIETLHEKDEAIQSLLRNTTVIGEEKKRLVNYLYGLSHLQAITVPHLPRTGNKFVFFTRPFLNLSNSNLQRDRKLAEYMRDDTDSIQGYIRATLDVKGNLTGAFKSRLVNQHSPFINVFSNSLVSLTGFPDEMIEVWSSPSGVRKEQWGYGDGVIDINNKFDLNATFINVAEEPIPKMLGLWLRYISLQKSGIITRYKEAWYRREIDYMTGIWVIVLNNTNTRIVRIAKTIGFPTANPEGKYFNYNRNERSTKDFKDINTKFTCFGVEYNDPLLLLEFNMLMGAFNPDIKEFLKSGTGMVKVSNELLYSANFRAMPLIDLKYNTLEWMVKKDNIEKKQYSDNENIFKEH